MWTIHNSRQDIASVQTTVEAGDTIDFVVDFNGEITHDEHMWEITIRQDTTDGAKGSVWDSVRDFRGTGDDPWVDLTHALMMTNEFVFVD